LGLCGLSYGLPLRLFLGEEFPRGLSREGTFVSFYLCLAGLLFSRNSCLKPFIARILLALAFRLLRVCVTLSDARDFRWTKKERLRLVFAWFEKNHRFSSFSLLFLVDNGLS
jgi:hypothetical protein